MQSVSEELTINHVVGWIDKGTENEISKVAIFHKGVEVITVDYLEKAGFIECDFIPLVGWIITNFKLT